MRLPIRAAAVIAAIAVAVALVLLVPPLMVPTDGLTPAETAEHIGNARSALIQVLAGGALLGGLFYTASTFRLNREGQITDRFSKAVEHLGSAALETRIGGIYALERIMRDSAADHSPIVEIISAFVREHATDRGEPEPIGESSTTMQGPPVPGVQALRADVQAAVTVLARRPTRRENAPLDLRGTDLRGVRAHEARFANAILTDTQLDHADLGVADLSNARLRTSSLKKAWLRAADLRNASLRYADMRGAYLVGVDLSAADMEKAKLDNAVYQVSDPR